VDAEREWLELIGHVLVTPLTVLPEERIATALTATFDAVACGFHHRPDPGTVVQRVYPPTLFSAALQAEWVRLSIETPRCHPLLHYYMATGDLIPQQVADVPSGLVGPRGRAQWAELSREHGIEHQLAIPLPPSSEGPRWFVLGRPDAFSTERMRLACRVQTLIAGLDRQAAALRHWQRRATQPDAENVASDVHLTPRELSVLTLVADGLTAAAVARRLVVAERTVHKHLERAYAKLGVSDRVSAVLRAQRLGILPEPVLALAR
jgi:DNA-binding CsgD family transcriptional regulator